MTVFDIVQTTEPGTCASYPAGSYAVEMRSTREAADEYAARCNQCVMVPGIRYTVHEIDELDPDRLPTLQQIRRGEAEPR